MPGYNTKYDNDQSLLADSTESDGEGFLKRYPVLHIPIMPHLAQTPVLLNRLYSAATQYLQKMRQTLAKYPNMAQNQQLLQHLQQLSAAQQTCTIYMRPGQDGGES